MHAPLPVIVTVGRPLWFALAMLAYWAAGGLLLILWLAEPAPASWRDGLGASVVLLHACVLLGYWARLPRGTLGWNGTDWDWTDVGEGIDASRIGEIELCLDLQHAQLLRFIAGKSPAVWLWLDRGMAPGHWDQVRRATRNPADRGPLRSGQVGVR